jgi:hypothetical protein
MCRNQEICESIQQEQGDENNLFKTGTGRSMEIRPANIQMALACTIFTRRRGLKCLDRARVQVQDDLGWRPHPHRRRNLVVLCTQPSVHLRLTLTLIYYMASTRQTALGKVS